MDHIDLIFILLFILYFMWPAIWAALKALLVPKRGDPQIHSSPARKEKQAEVIWGSKTKEGIYGVYDTGYVSKVSPVSDVQKAEPEIKSPNLGVRSEISAMRSIEDIISNPEVLENNKSSLKLKKKPIFQTFTPRSAFLYKELLDRPVALRKKPVFRAD